MSDTNPHDLPSPFVVRWAKAPVERRAARALDVAMGRGRHAGLLADQGFLVFGVDWKLDAVHDAMDRAAAAGRSIRGWCADLTTTPLPRGRFDLVVVTRYLQRDLFPSLRETLAPGGLIVYETFTEAQRALGWGPTSPDHLLRPGELRACFEGFEVLSYEEVSEPEAVARIAARKP
jgi:SAM-dependent methyltransferase